MAQIDWSIINNTPNVFALGMQGLQAGQENARLRERQGLMKRQEDRAEAQYQAGLDQQARRRQAMATYATDPAAGRTKALEAGDFDLVDQINKLDASQRELAGKNATEIASVAFSAKAKPYEQRKAFLTNPQTAQYLTQRGFTPEQISSFDPTDDALDSIMSQGQTFAEKLAQHNADRDFKLKSDDTAADNTRADEQFAWQKHQDEIGNRNDATRLGMDRERLGLERERVGIERGKAAQTAQGKPLPAPIQTGYIGNQQSIRQIDEAIAALKAYPQAVGLLRSGPEGVNQRVDPRGVEARAKVANIGSLIIHDRAGASQTVGETKRLTPFVPGVTDGARAAIKKLETLRSQYVNENSGIEVAYGEGSGYRALPRSAPAGGGGGPVRVNTPAEARALPSGTRFVTPDGREKVR